MLRQLTDCARVLAETILLEASKTSAVDILIIELSFTTYICLNANFYGRLQDCSLPITRGQVYTLQHHRIGIADNVEDALYNATCRCRMP